MFSIFIRRVIMVHSILDFRKQWNGLLVEARRSGFEPNVGDLVVFVKRDKTLLRAISGDEKSEVQTGRIYASCLLANGSAGSARRGCAIVRSTVENHCRKP